MNKSKHKLQEVKTGKWAALTKLLSLKLDTYLMSATVQRKKTTASNAVES